MSPPDEAANANATVTAPNQFTSHQIAVTQGTSDEITEDLEDDNYSQDNDFENEEEKSIKEIRREELRKNIFEKDEKRLTDYLNLRRVSQLEQQLKTKDKQIKQLTKLVQHSGQVRSEIMSINETGGNENNINA